MDPLSKHLVVDDDDEEEEDDDESTLPPAEVSALADPLARDFKGGGGGTAASAESDVNFRVLFQGISESKQDLGQWQRNEEQQHKLSIQQHPPSLFLVYSHIPSAKPPERNPFVRLKNPFEALDTSQPPLSKKQSTSENFLGQSFEVVTGINLREEEKLLLSASQEGTQAAEASRRVIQEEEKFILNKGPLHKKLADIMPKYDIKNISSGAELCLSLGVEEFLRRLLIRAIKMSKQRVDMEKTKHQIVTAPDIRNKIASINQKAKEEWDKKQAEELQTQRKRGDMVAGSTKDKGGDRRKNVKEKQEEVHNRRQAANAAVQAAVGGDDLPSKWQLISVQAQQKQEGLNKCSTSQSGGSIPRNIRTHNFRTQAEHPNLEETRCISLKDLITALETDPQMSKSPWIYRLYDRLWQDLDKK